MVKVLVGIMVLHSQADAHEAVRDESVRLAVKSWLGQEVELTAKTSMHATSGRTYAAKTPNGQQYIVLASEGIVTGGEENQGPNPLTPHQKEQPIPGALNLVLPGKKSYWIIDQDGSPTPCTYEEAKGHQMNQLAQQERQVVTIEVQRRAPGKDLRRILLSYLQGRISQRRMLQIAYQLGRSIAQLHNLGLIEGTTETETAHNDLHGGNVVVGEVEGQPTITFIDIDQRGHADVRSDLCAIAANIAGAIAEAGKKHDSQQVATLYAAMCKLHEGYNEEHNGEEIRFVSTQDLFWRLTTHGCTSTIMMQGTMFPIDKDRNKSHPYTRQEAFEALGGVTTKWYGEQEYDIIDLMYPYCSLAEYRKLYGDGKPVGHTVATSVMGEILRESVMNHGYPLDIDTWIEVASAVQEAATTIGEGVGESYGLDCRPAIAKFEERLREIMGRDS
ncbi:MAG: hypothetical protein LBD43_01630 [Holosporales bacterium]|jgi:tRNA A-37 threonylcarbamoyl transferase component Bud32|nr:hypothetical protein [Holosporales bacterium]